MPESGYGVGEAAIAALVLTVSGFTAAQVSRGDFGVLNTGKGEVYAILVQEQPGERSGRQQVTEAWNTAVQVWRRYKNDGSTATNLYADVDKVLVKIGAYPHLGDTSGYVVESEPALAGAPEEMWLRGGGPAWLRQTINVRWIGQRTRTFLD